MTAEDDGRFGDAKSGNDAARAPMAPAPSGDEASESQHRPYVRPRRPHKSLAPVNDVEADESFERDYAAETSYTLSSRGPMASHAYRKSRSDISHVKRELKYGQYLSFPNGSREIFGGHDRKRRQVMAVGVIALVAIVLVIAIFVLVVK